MLATMESLIILLSVLSVFCSAHRFGYSAAEQRLWKRKHTVGEFCAKPFENLNEFNSLTALRRPSSITHSHPFSSINSHLHAGDWVHLLSQSTPSAVKNSQQWTFRVLNHAEAWQLHRVPFHFRGKVACRVWVCRAAFSLGRQEQSWIGECDRKMEKCRCE